jgi:Copper amine oxidase N-terminal domain
MSGSRIFVPLRLISEAAGAAVAYSATPQAVRITGARAVVAAAARSLRLH